MTPDSLHSFGQATCSGAKDLLGKPSLEFRESNANCLEIGLINNMPDTALGATERQFLSLLNAAAQGIVVHVRLFTLPDVPRSPWGQDHVSSCYSSVSDLWNTHLDGLIVTGTEPRAPDLRDEPYWESLTRVLDWAEHNTTSTVWSCLAAHACVLHIDGIHRRPLNNKRFGIFECARVSGHQLMAAAPSRIQMPHSRWNDLPEDALRACGYRVLTRSDDAGVDAFVKQRKSLFVFFQGHPEYDRDAILLEYRRDIGRFLRRERETYPPMPHGYFDESTVDTLLGLQERAVSDRREELLADFPTDQLASKVANTWRSAASCIYRNWLRYMCAHKDRELRARAPSERVKAVFT